MKAGRARKDGRPDESAGPDGVRQAVVFAVVGPVLLVALAVGAVVDLAIAAVYLAVSRRRAREA